MIRERNEWPSTAGGLPAEERSGYAELCVVASRRVRCYIGIMSHVCSAEEFRESAEFYARNYETLTPFVGKKVPSPRCRFCGQSEPQVSFHKKAHAYPEFLGNKYVFSFDECDDCNEFFGNDFENDAAKYFGLGLTLARTRGKRGVPKFKARRNEFHVSMDRDGLVAGIDDSNRRTIVYPLRRELEFRWLREPYRPYAVYKLLVKVGIAFLPPKEMVNFAEALKWLRCPVVGPRSAELATPIVLLSNAVNPIRGTKFWLLRRKNKNPALSYMIFAMQHSTTIHQIALPSPARDYVKSRQMFMPIPVSNPYELPQVKVMSNRDQVRMEVMRSTMKYEGLSTQDLFARSHWLDIQY